MNRKAFELAINTLILIILGVLVLIALAYVLTGGFKSFKSSSEPFLQTTESSSIKQACQLACTNQDKITFCCSNFTIQEKNIRCTDPRLEIQCDFSCAEIQCNPQKQISEQEVIQMGERLAGWSTDNHLLIKINNLPINKEGPSSGSQSPVYWDNDFKGTLKLLIEQSTCDPTFLQSYFPSLSNSKTKEQLSQDLKCLGTFEFTPVTFNPD